MGMIIILIGDPLVGGIFLHEQIQRAHEHPDPVIVLQEKINTGEIYRGHSIEDMAAMMTSVTLEDLHDMQTDYFENIDLFPPDSTPATKARIVDNAERSGANMNKTADIGRSGES